MKETISSIRNLIEDTKRLLQKPKGPVRLLRETTVSKLPQKDIRLFMETAILLSIAIVVHIELP